MSSEKPNFLSQPVVKNIFMFRNGDPYYEARRIVINQRRVSNFDTLLRDVTGGIQAPFGAVRSIYTPRGGHKVNSIENLKSGEQYVAAGREKFKKLDYLEIGSRRKRMLLPAQVKPPPQNRIIASARFLKPIKEPCAIFVVANGDVLNPAVRLLIHQRMLGQFDRILEMITEKMGLRVLGGVRSLYTYEGTPVNDGNQLESGQLYVAVGRERFRRMPYIDLLFPKPRGMRRVNGMKAYSLPPLYRFTKQNENSKSVVNSTDRADSGDSKTSPPRHSSSKKEHLSSIVREISQARLISLRKKRSGQSMTLGISDNADLDAKADVRDGQDNGPPDLPGEEKPADEVKAEERGEKMVKEEEGDATEAVAAAAAGEAAEEEEAPPDKKILEEKQDRNSDGEIEENKKSGQKDGEDVGALPGPEQSEEKEEEQRGEEVKEEAETTAEDTIEEEALSDKKESEGSQEIIGVGKIEKGKSDEQQDGEVVEAPPGPEEKEEEEQRGEEVKEEADREEQKSANNVGDEAQSNNEDEVISNEPSNPDGMSKHEQKKQEVDEKQDQESREEEKSSEEPVDAARAGERKKEEDVSPGPNETEESVSNSNQEHVSGTKEGDSTESRAEEINGEVVDNVEGEEGEGGNSTNPIQTTPDGSNVGDEKEGTVSERNESQ
ncbi:doublecortin domain-containing protein 2 [Takifugu rubripes]|uniref:Doublecortin domain-containing protein 2 n=1 Tax=Takifugu rubripes TaxID=31033 RepID=A0A3B5K1R3_TAKRU|nr:doublecortin domain-containing protein 2 [Takifugu rubripes]